jgi:multidrug transporter EmrE-like cation transporter
MNYVLFWIFIIIGTFLESVGDVAFRYATIANKEFYRWVGYIVYVLGSASWAISLKYHELTKGLIVFIALNVFMVAIASKYMFSENLNVNQMIGIFLVLLGIFFVES